MKNRITQAVILSAGFGTRLKPITDKIPKVMAPFSGKPLLQWHIEQLKKHGVEEFFINLFYLPEVVKNHFGDGSKFGIKINYFLEKPEILGTAGGIKDFDGKLKDNFFVVYGDVFSLLDYTKMAENFIEKQDNPIGMTIVGFNDHPHDSDIAQVDENLKFIKVYPKPNKELPPNWRVMRTTFIFNERILPHIPQGEYYEIDHQ
ncbi:MAG: nucleotidyltransferase family protein, partial [Patescibacteria group bacterium]